MRRIAAACLGWAITLAMLASVASIASATAGTAASLTVSGHIVPPVQYRVVYDGNGGAREDGVWRVAGPDIREGGTDIVLSLSDTGFLRDGYTFTGWNTEKDGSGRAYTPGRAITLNNNVILYAQWTKDEETLDSRDKPGKGSVIGTLPGIVVPWDSSSGTIVPYIETEGLTSGTTEQEVKDTAGTSIGKMLLGMTKTGDPANVPLWAWASLLIVPLAAAAYLLWIAHREKRHEAQKD